MSTKKKTAVILTILCAAALLSACGRGKTAEPSMPLEPAEAETASVPGTSQQSEQLNEQPSSGDSSFRGSHK